MKKILFSAVALCALVGAQACSDEDSNGMNGGAGQAGSGGSAGAEETGGAAGRGGSDAGGSAGAPAGSGGGGNPGMAGSAGSGGGVSEPLGRDNPPELGAQIDRVGRPAISTALVETFNSDAAAKGAAKDAYNAAGDPKTWSSFVPQFSSSLGILDALDGTCGNQLLASDEADSRYAALAGVLADDKLYVNTPSGTCSTYLGVEAQFLGAVEDGGCGGRTPNDDVIDRSYSVLAAGLLTGVDDTITEDDATHNTTEFPFLAE